MWRLSLLALLCLWLSVACVCAAEEAEEEEETCSADDESGCSAHSHSIRNGVQLAGYRAERGESRLTTFSHFSEYLCRTNRNVSK